MSEHMDPELNEVLADPELIRIARMLSSVTSPEPPLDDAFKTGLRRQLMADAWRTVEGKNTWWRRLLAPQALAWAGAAAVVVVVASVVLYTTNQPTGGGPFEIVITSPLKDSSAVALQQPILVSFNQPMNHQTTEHAVEITPATNVTFTWAGGDTQLYVQPTSGNLAPNTQYQVTIGPGATTQAGTPLAAPTTITFVTQPVASPTPPTSPTPRNNSLLTGQQQLTAAYPPSGTTYRVIWSADSSTIYFVGAGGALESVPAGGGAAKTLVPDGASLPAIAPAGDRLAYVRGGKIEILTLATGATTELVVTPAPTALSWVKDQLFWGTNEGVYQAAIAGPVRIASIPPPNDDTAIVSIAPDGAHAVFAGAKALHLLDIVSGKVVDLVGGSTTFQGWSPDGTRVVFNDVIADMNGRTITSLAAGDVSWSAKNEILLGGDTGLYEVRPDGSGLTKLADGTYDLPVWAPDGSTFAFVRAGLWVATAPAPPPPAPQTDQAASVVTAFMQARLEGNADRALVYLDDAGKAAYNTGNPPLIPLSEAGFKRFYILTSEVDPSTTNGVRVVVRMVFAQGKVETSTLEETLTLKRAEPTDPFLIDAVTAGSQRDVGKGPEVVAVKITSTQVEVTFDSDLVPTSVAGVILQDSQGRVVTATQTYTDRMVTFSGLQLTPGAHYRLVVVPTLRDVGDRHAESEYDLDLVGPPADLNAGAAAPTPPAPASPSPSPSPS
jgi:Big-like domain-containing protein/WD40 repeat protein